jgi:hypothetical protein
LCNASSSALCCHSRAETVAPRLTLQGLCKAVNVLVAASACKRSHRDRTMKKWIIFLDDDPTESERKTGAGHVRLLQGVQAYTEALQRVQNRQSSRACASTTALVTHHHRPGRPQDRPDALTARTHIVIEPRERTNHEPRWPPRPGGEGFAKSWHCHSMDSASLLQCLLLQVLVAVALSQHGQCSARQLLALTGPSTNRALRFHALTQPPQSAARR